MTLGPPQRRSIDLLHYDAPASGVGLRLRVVEASEGSLRLRTIPIQVRDALNGKWMAAFLALVALVQGAEKLPPLVDAVRGDGAACKVNRPHAVIGPHGAGHVALRLPDLHVHRAVHVAPLALRTMATLEVFHEFGLRP